MKDPELKGSHIKKGADPYVGGEVRGRQESAWIWMSGKVICVTRGDLYAMIIATHMGRHKEVCCAIVVSRRSGMKGNTLYVIKGLHSWIN